MLAAEGSLQKKENRLKTFPGNFLHRLLSCLVNANVHGLRLAVCANVSACA